MPTRTVFSATAFGKYNSTDHDKMPKGWLGYATLTSDQTGIGTGGADLTGMSLSVTVPATRMLQLAGHVQVADASAALTALVEIKEGGTTLGRSVRQYLADSNDRAIGTGWTLVVGPSAASHTYKLTGSSSTGTFSVDASATAPSSFVILDIGPSS